MVERIASTAAARCRPPPCPFDFGPQQQSIKPPMTPRRPPIDETQPPKPKAATPKATTPELKLRMLKTKGMMKKPMAQPAKHLALFTSGATSGFEPHMEDSRLRVRPAAPPPRAFFLLRV